MKIIVYIDMDAFFASCHQVQNRFLQAKPLVVSGFSRRAIVSSASYEARKYGIKTAIPLFLAKSLCPGLINVAVTKQLYDYYSEQIFYLLQKTFPVTIEKCSIDEFCIDITSIYHKYGSALKCAKMIQKVIFDKWQLTCSIGISYNKFLAKIASEMNKPGGIFIIKPSILKEVLWPLSITNIHGIGPKTVKKLNLINVYTVGDFVKSEQQMQLKKIMQKRYFFYWEYFTSKVTDDIKKNSKRKSIGCDFTFEYNIADEKIIIKFLEKIVKVVSDRAQKIAVAGGIIVVAIKNTNFKWQSKQLQLRWYTNNYETLYDYAFYLLKLFTFQEPIRAVRFCLKRISKQGVILKPLQILD